MSKIKSSLPFVEIKPLPEYLYVARVFEKYLNKKKEREFWVGYFNSKEHIIEHFSNPFFQKEFVYRGDRSILKLLGYKKIKSKNRFRSFKSTTYSKI